MTILYYAIKDESNGKQTIAIWEGDRAEWKAVGRMESTRPCFRQVHQSLLSFEVHNIIQWHHSMGNTLIKQRWCDRPLGQRPDPKFKRPAPGANQLIAISA